MNRGGYFTLTTFLVLVVIFIAAPLLIYCQNAHHHKSSQQQQSPPSNNNNKQQQQQYQLPTIVEDTSARFKAAQPEAAASHHKQHITGGELTKIDSKNDLIYLNTIDGLMYAVSKNDGKIKWSLEEEAVLKFPENYEKYYSFYNIILISFFL